MEPVGPWFTSYNRFTNQQSGHPGAELHSGGPPQPPPTSQLFLGTPHHPGTNVSAAAPSPFPPGPSGFLSPQPITYDPVFNPLFHQKGHYRAFKQPSDVETYNFISSSGSNYFEQSNSTPLAWTQNNQLHSPFGVLPHESVIQSTSVVKPFENLGHFTQQTINHFNAQTDYKNLDYDNRRFSSPMKTNAPIFCQTVNDYQRFQNHLQQGFSSVQDPNSRYPQPSFRGNQFLQKNDSSCECGPRYVRPLIHPEPKVSESAEVQSSPISYAMFDNHRSYQGNKLEHQSFHLNHLNYNRFSSSEDCVQRSRGLKGLVEAYGGRPSPVTSPVYPLYYHNSPVTASSSNSSPSPVDAPQTTQDNQLLVYQQPIRPPAPLCKSSNNPPLDVTLSRPVAYASVIPRSALSKNVNLPRNEEESWESREKRSFPTCAEIQTPLHLQSLKSCRGDPMSLVKTLQQQNQQAPIKSANFEPDKKHISADFFNRVPPPAHHNAFNQQVQNGYFDFERWNSAKMFSTPSSFATAQNNHSGKFSIHPPSTPHLQPQPASYGPLPTYIPSLTLPSPIPEAIAVVDEVPVTKDSQGHNHPEKNPSLPNMSPPDLPTKSTNPSVAKPVLVENVPSIEEELGILQDDTVPSRPKEPLVRTKKNVGFMNEFIRFIQENDHGSTCSKASKHQLEIKCPSDSSAKTVKSGNLEEKLHPKNAVVEESVDGDNIGETDVSDAVKRRRTNRQSKEESTVSKSAIQSQGHPMFPYEVGEFIVLKSDLHLLHPPIWKVKKNLLLQKFTHFISRGVAFYSNVPVFTGWSPESKKVYEKAQIRIIKQKKEDMVVKLIPTNMIVFPSGSNLLNTVVEENEKYREAFEVYVQALFSQALDSNFLREIRHEKDDYFLSCIKAVEGFWSDLVSRLKDVLVWSESDFEKLLGSPNYRYAKGVHSQEKCVCLEPATISTVLGGLPYSMETLEISKTPVPQQIISLCDSCRQSFEILHKLTHQKYLLFSVCDDKVTAKKVECLNNDASIILNDLLKDDDWFNKVFCEFLKLWGYAGKITEDLVRLKNINKDVPSD